MRQEKWDMYINCLQKHPSACKAGHTTEKMNFVTEFLPLNTHRRMLNIGAGEGLETYVLQNLGYDVIAIINGKANVDFAIKNYPDINFIDTDFHDLPFKSETFDCVYMNHVFEHAYAPFVFLLELYSVLRKKGRIWTAMPHFKEINDPTLGESNKLSHHHPNILCNNLFTELFEATGFKIIYNTPRDNNIYFDNPYLLEKQPISTLHSDVQLALQRRKELFG